jgi:hypothetical protein
MKLTIRVFAFAIVAAAFASNFHSQKYSAPTPHQVVSSAIPIPLCPPDGKTTCGLK